MRSLTAYTRYTWFVLVMVFLVILAGGIVRMTQSGMGCPDWPTCFGRWIPPVTSEQLPPDFEKYLRTQDIDHSFNVYHTWIEYINRLLGALLGVFIFIHFIWSFRKFRSTNRSIIFLSLFLLLAVGFQGWLGKKVVDDNLAVVKVTTHMLVALLIAAIPVMIIARVNTLKTDAGRLIKTLSVVTLLLVIVQIVLGTDVREQIDEISRPLKYEQRELWIGELDIVFLFHRSFSWVIAAASILLCWKSWSYSRLRNHQLLILFLIGASIITGLTMFYLNIPAIAQPVHLFSASLLAISLFSFRLQLK